jgi:Kef-type K+ transport system membrane component KefB
MSATTATSLLFIAIAAVLAPVLAELLRRYRVPSVLFELLLGIVIGPAVLGVAQADGFVQGLSTLGLAFLFFVAGYEIDFSRLRGSPIKRGVSGWAISLVLGLTIGLVLMAEGFVLSSLLVGLALTTTAIGTLLPMLHDRALLSTRFGDFLAAGGAAGEFGPILAVTVLLGTARPGTEGLLLLAFVLLALAVAFMASRPQPPRFVEVMERHLSTSTQLPVRLVILLITAMVFVAAALGLDILLGAFAAGLIGRLAFNPERSSSLEPRLESIGYGFLIPVFFIVSGMEFDVTQLFTSAATAVRVPIFVALFLLVRGLPALAVYRRLLPIRERTSMCVLQATALPMLVVITKIGLQSGDMRSDTATALVGAGMVSVLVFPLVGFALLDRVGGPPADDAVLPPSLQQEDGAEPPPETFDPSRDPV